MTSSACHTTGTGDFSSRLPWSGDPRAAAKTELLRYARENPTGIRPTVAARSVLDPDARGGDRDARFARRFYENHSDLFKITRQGRDTWVEPRPAAFHLNRRKHRAKNGDGGGVGYDTEGTPEVEAGRTGEDGPEVVSVGEDNGPRKFAKDRVRSFLSRYASIRSGATRAALLDGLATELASIEDRVTVMEKVRGSGPDYLLAPYRTRFNSPSRVAENQERFREAFARAEAEFEEAVVVTLTTDPGRHDSILDATDSLLENKNRLSAWLSYDPENSPSRPGYRPPNVYALEFTDSGLPHLHVAYFGVRWLAPQGTLAKYWRDRGQGEVVHVRRAVKRDDEFVMTGQKDGRRPTVRRYFSKTLRDLSILSRLSPEEVKERGHDPGWRSRRPVETRPLVGDWKASVGRVAVVNNRGRRGRIRRGRPGPSPCPAVSFCRCVEIRQSPGIHPSVRFPSRQGTRTALTTNGSIHNDLGYLLVNLIVSAMERIKALLLPTGIGVLIVVLGSITDIMDAGFAAARTGPAALGDFLYGFLLFFILVLFILALIARISASV